MKRKLMALIIGLSLITGSVRAFTTFTITAADLQNQSGGLIPTNALVLLVVDTAANGFTSLSNGMSLVAGPLALGADDVIVARWECGFATGAEGFIADLTDPSISYVGGVTAGDPVALYWFPTYTGTTTLTSTGDRYGRYTTNTVLDGSVAWVMPADTGGTLDLRFFTSGNSAGETGSNPALAGRADLVVIPEPSTMLLAGVGLLSFLVAARYRRK
jgi:hypothetical protein